eukprot:12497644-Alexandrium_andersonii.AAC.1
MGIPRDGTCMVVDRSAMHSMPPFAELVSRQTDCKQRRKQPRARREVPIRVAQFNVLSLASSARAKMPARR